MHSQKALKRDGLCSRDVAIVDREPACFVRHMLQRARKTSTTRALKTGLERGRHWLAGAPGGGPGMC